jgi:hypothetical protein
MQGAKSKENAGSDSLWVGRVAPSRAVFSILLITGKIKPSARDGATRPTRLNRQDENCCNAGSGVHRFEIRGTACGRSKRKIKDQE